MRSAISRRVWVLRVTALISALLPPLGATAISASPEDAQHVLVLHSYHPDLDWTRTQSNGIDATFAAASRPVFLHHEYLDAKRHPALEHEQAFANLLRAKYPPHSIDLIMVSDDPALDFILSDALPAYAEIPVIFSGINHFRPSLAATTRRVTGVLETLSIAETLREAIRQTAADGIITLVNTTSTGVANSRSVAQVRQDMADEALTWVELTDVVDQDAAVALSAYPSHWPVLVLSPLRRGSPDGPFWHHEEAISYLQRTVNNPLYVPLRSMVGHGAVGGRVLDGFLHGTQAADMALRVLLGTPIEAMEILRKSPHQWVFDSNVLTHFNIPVSSLPPDHILVNHHTSFYDRHPLLVLTILAVFGFLAVLITLLTLKVRQRNATTDRLRRREQDLTITLNAIGDAVIACDNLGTITRLNPRAAELLGTDERTAVQQPLRQLFQPVEYDNQQPIEDPLEAAAGAESPKWLWQREGQGSRLLSPALSTIVDRGRAVGTVLVLRDLTHVAHLEQSIHQAQKMEVIGRLAGAVAHDFNNLLSGIVGYTETLKLRLRDTPAAHRYLDRILAICDRATELTRRLLTFSRQPEARQEPIQLQHVLDEVIALLERTMGKRLHIDLEFAAHHPTLLGDAAALQNALLNLGLNACEAMQAGGTLRFSSQLLELKERPPNAIGNAFEPGPFVRIGVSDTGRGMPADILEQIFEPFFTTRAKEGGTGLGLASVYACVEQHKGFVSVTSLPDVGTTFHVFLPVGDTVSDTNDAPTPDHPPQRPLDGISILLVDDEPSPRHATQALLREMGLAVSTVASGEEALSWYRKHGETVRVVLLDLLMPGMSGEDTFRALREINPAVVCVIMSGFGLEKENQRLRDAGVHAVLNKPFTQASLYDALRTAAPQIKLDDPSRSEFDRSHLTT